MCVRGWVDDQFLLRICEGVGQDIDGDNITACAAVADKTGSPTHGSRVFYALYVHQSSVPSVLRVAMRSLGHHGGVAMR